MRAMCSVIASIVAVLVSACTLGGMSSVNREVESPKASMSTAYANAIRAMNDIGKVTNSDKEAGYVNGSSRSGVDIVATITQTSSGIVKLNAKGTLPAGKIRFHRITWWCPSPLNESRLR